MLSKFHLQCFPVTIENAKFNPEDKRFQALKTHPLLEEMEKIIIAVDNDSSGKALEMELTQQI